MSKMGDARDYRKHPGHREHKFDSQQEAMRRSSPFQVAAYCPFCESWYVALHPALVQARQNGVPI